MILANEGRRNIAQICIEATLTTEHQILGCARTEERFHVVHHGSDLLPITKLERAFLLRPT